MIDAIRSGLTAKIDQRLVDEMLAAHAEAKQNFYLGGYRLNAVEAGRFCEAAFRILQQVAFAKFDRLGVSLDTDKLIRELGQLPSAAHPDAVRLHIPRALRVVYDIRNKRDNAHLADGIDPNVQDATLVVGTIDWILAEFIRLYHGVPATEAKAIVDAIVQRSTPAVQDFDGFLKVLRTDLMAGDHVMLCLYQRAGLGATAVQLENWARPKMRANLRRTLSSLEDDKAYVHSTGSTFFITASGIRFVEGKRLLDSP